jgi:fatty acid-binding protein DegV
MNVFTGILHLVQAVVVLTLTNGRSLQLTAAYAAKGKWADYIRGETVYVILSLTAKSALAWQVFANVLLPST